MGENHNGPIGTRPEDELAAMQALTAALGGLDDASVRRVLRWAAERFGLEPPPRITNPIGGRASLPTDEHHEDLATLFSHSAPESGPERALVVAYYLQEMQGAPELDAQAINAALKNLGHPLSNVTSTLSLLIRQSPSLMVQTRKLGRGQQARKRYRVTTAGIARVRQMLAHGVGEEGQG